MLEDSKQRLPFFSIIDKLTPQASCKVKTVNDRLISRKTYREIGCEVIIGSRCLAVERITIEQMKREIRLVLTTENRSFVS